MSDRPQAGPRFDIASLHSAYAASLDPAVMVDTVLARIAKAGDPGIFIHLCDRDALLAQAAALGSFDPVGKPLWGIPCAIKDNIDVAGMPTTAACPAYAYTPSKDATVVGRLRAAGAIIVGKTNLDQFATGLVGLRTPYPPADQSDRCRAHPGRLVLGFRGRGLPRHRRLRARNRHRGIGPGTGRAQQYRRAEADARRDFHRRRRACLSHAGLRLRLRPHRR